MLNACAVIGTPAVGFAFSAYGPANGESGIVAERTCESS